MKLCIGYARVSTNQQATGLESQVRLLNDYFANQGISQFEIITDEAISGTKDTRPGLDRLMDMVRRGQVKQVVVPAFSRFARSTVPACSRPVGAANSQILVDR